MKLYVYENEIRRLPISYVVMGESKKEAAKMIADKLRQDLEEDAGKPFDFTSFHQKCVESRQKFIDCLDNGELKQTYIDGMNKWKDHTELWQHVENECDEYSANEVVVIQKY